MKQDYEHSLSSVGCVWLSSRPIARGSTSEARKGAGPVLPSAARAAGPPPPRSPWPSTLSPSRWAQIFPRHTLAVRALLGTAPAKRRSALVVIDMLAANPFATPDLLESAASGRVYFVVVRENVIVTYWVDHAVRELRIIQLEFV